MSTRGVFSAFVLSWAGVSGGCLAQPVPAPVTPLPAAPAATVAPGQVGMVAFPSLSPDGSLMVFSWLGDLWAVSSQGGPASRLTSHPAEERRSAFSPDGSLLAFESDREGSRNLYIVPITSAGPNGPVQAGRVRRVTALDRAQTLTSWTPDGSALLFSGSIEATVFRGTQMFRVPVLTQELANDDPATIVGGPIERLTPAFGTQPRLSADGSTLYFARRRPEPARPRYSGSGASDLVAMTMSTGEFTTLTSDARSDAEPFPLPDGSVLFISSRSGTHNLLRLPAGARDDRAARALTNFQPGDKATIAHGVRDLAVNAAGTVAVFSVFDTVYRMDLTRADTSPTPMSVASSLDASDLELARLNISREVTEQAISPDGKTLAVIARGEVFIRSTDEGRPTRRVTNFDGKARARDLAWSPDNRVLFFTSDQTGSSMLYYATVALSRGDIRPDAATGGTGEKTDKPEEPEAGKAAAPAAKTDEYLDALASQELAAQPPSDPAASTGGSPAPASDAAARPRRPARPKVDHAKRWSESIRFEVKPLDLSAVPAGKNDGVLGPEWSAPIPSPDGKQLLLTRGLGDVVLFDLTKRSGRVIIEGWNAPSLQWASDSRHVILAREDLDFNSDIWLVDTQAEDAMKSATNLTRHPDPDLAPQLSADGKVLYFLSERLGGGERRELQVYCVFLDKSLEGLRPFELDEYFKKAAENARKRKPIEPVMWDQPASPSDGEASAKVEAAGQKEEAVVAAAKPDAQPDAKPESKPDTKPESKPETKADARKAEPLKFDASDAWQRVRRITTGGGSKGSLSITPGGDRIITTGDADGGTERALLNFSFKGDDRRVVQVGAVSDVRMSLTGDRVSFVRQGSVSAASLGAPKVDALAIEANIVVRLADQQSHKFREAARILGNGFYHPTLKGLNWPALVERYDILARRTRTSDEFDRVVNMLFGELDGSHTGINSSGGFSAPSPATGYLGIDFEAVPGGYRVTRVLPQGPGDREQSRLKVDDVIVSVDGQRFAATDDARPRHDFHAMFMSRAGRELLLEIRRAGESKPVNLLIVPISSGEDTDLRYRDTVQRRTALVNELSGGKLGYLHVRSMNEQSVRDFERDLFAAADGKLGLIIDVRDNGGGSTADILLASLTAPRHTWTAPRGVELKNVPRDAYPRDRRLIFGFVRPISVLINENSFSNAEIFAHAIKTIGRGKLVGTATYGGVISTGAASLIDGSTVRTPFRGWYLPDGRDLENNGAEPDLNVPQTAADDARGHDAQLKAAVDELLGRAQPIR
ncbi:MAG: S41 family peptidase [Planctomyces sp.]